MFQQTNLYPWLTVYENVAFGLKARGVYREQKAHVQETQLAAALAARLSSVVIAAKGAATI